MKKLQKKIYSLQTLHIYISLHCVHNDDPFIAMNNFCYIHAVHGMSLWEAVLDLHDILP